MMNIELYNRVLQKFLQAKVTFKCGNKVLKTGTIKLFNIKQYFIKFYIESDKKEVKILEIPYPFKIEYDGNICTLNYKLSSLCNNYTPTVSKLYKCRSADANKMYDSVVVIAPLVIKGTSP